MLIILKRGAEREGVITRVEVKINRDMWRWSCHVQGCELTKNNTPVIGFLKFSIIR